MAWTVYYYSIMLIVVLMNLNNLLPILPTTQYNLICFVFFKNMPHGLSIKQVPVPCSSDEWILPYSCITFLTLCNFHFTTNIKSHKFIFSFTQWSFHLYNIYWFPPGDSMWIKYKNEMDFEKKLKKLQILETGWWHFIKTTLFLTKIFFVKYVFDLYMDFFQFYTNDQNGLIVECSM